MTVIQYYVTTGGVVVARLDDGREEVVTPALSKRANRANVIDLSSAVRQKNIRWAA